MALDLSTLSRQVRAMSGSLVREAGDKRDRLLQVRARYLQEAAAHEHWGEAADLSRETLAWLLARPVEPLNRIRALPPRPPSYALIATDGSQIDMERHGAALCYVINIGRVFLRYGAQPAARLSSAPTLYYRDEDLYLSDGVRRIAIEGNYLSARRDVEEGVALVGLADEFLSDTSAQNERSAKNAKQREYLQADDMFALQDAARGTKQHKYTQNSNSPDFDHVSSRPFADETPAIALQDGTLVRWALAGAEKFVQDHFLRAYLDYLDAMRSRGIPVASYISRPRSPEVAGTIRLMLCPDVHVDDKRGAKCSECSDVAAGREPSCMACQGLTDAEVLADMLDEGQRGPLFLSMSRINIENYGPHQIYFFYMRVGREIGRVEMPQWVAEDAGAVDLIHSLIYDQCMKGQGYPVALARAHEQAIVRTADRRAFLGIVEGSLLRAELPATSSRKRESKERQAL